MNLNRLKYRVSLFLCETWVSARTLSVWECDETYPTWAQQPKIIEYLGYNPFTDSTLGMPGGNESSVVAVLALETPSTIGKQILKRRIEQRKTRKDCAEELGVSVKSLWGWETGQWEPIASVRQRIEGFLAGVAITPSSKS